MLNRWICGVLGLSALAVLVSQPVRAEAAGFRVAYTDEGGYHEVYVWSPRPTGPGVSGEASLSSQDYDGRTVRRLLVCDRADDRSAVSAVISIPDGRKLAYPAPVGRCFSRDLGYPIAGWRLQVGAGLSGLVTTPPLV